MTNSNENFEIIGDTHEQKVQNMAQAKIEITADVVDNVPRNINLRGADVSLSTMSVFLAYFIECFMSELSKQDKTFADLQTALVNGFVKSLV